MSKKGLNMLCLILMFGTSIFPKTMCVGDTLQWMRIYGSAEGSETIWSVIQTTDGGFILSGTTFYSAESIPPPGMGHRNSWLMKTDADGEEQWTQPCSRGVSVIIQTVEGGFLLASGAWLMKLDAQGRLQWEQTYDLQDKDFVTVTFVNQTIDGGFVIGGQTFSWERGRSTWLGKTNARGELEWQQVYEGVVESRIIQTVDGGYAFVGSTQHSEGNWKEDGLLVKTDAKGVVQWNHTYGNPTSYDRGKSIIQTSDGGFVFVGITVIGWTYVWFVKTDAHGVRQWNGTHEFLSIFISDRASLLSQTADGGFVCVGSTLSSSEGDIDTWLIKIDTIGNIEWARIYAGPSRDIIKSVFPTADGGFAFAGVTTSYGAGKLDGWLLKTNPQGLIQWNRTYGGSENDYLHSIIQTADAGFILTGNTRSYGLGFSNAWLIKTDTQGIAPNPVKIKWVVLRWNNRLVRELIGLLIGWSGRLMLATLVIIITILGTRKLGKVLQSNSLDSNKEGKI